MKTQLGLTLAIDMQSTFGIKSETDQVRLMLAAMAKQIAASAVDALVSNELKLDARFKQYGLDADRLQSLKDGLDDLTEEIQFNIESAILKDANAFMHDVFEDAIYDKIQAAEDAEELELIDSWGGDPAREQMEIIQASGLRGL